MTNRILTWSSLLQQALEASREFHHMVRGPSPEHKAVSGISKSRVNLWSLQAQEIRVDHKLLEFRGEKLGLLLLISSDAVC